MATGGQGMASCTKHQQQVNNGADLLEENHRVCTVRERLWRPERHRPQPTVVHPGLFYSTKGGCMGHGGQDVSTVPCLRTSYTQAGLAMVAPVRRR